MRTEQQVTAVVAVGRVSGVGTRMMPSRPVSWLTPPRSPFASVETEFSAVHWVPTLPVSPVSEVTVLSSVPLTPCTVLVRLSRPPVSTDTSLVSFSILSVCAAITSLSWVSTVAEDPCGPCAPVEPLAPLTPLAPAGPWAPLSPLAPAAPVMFQFKAFQPCLALHFWVGPTMRIMPRWDRLPFTFMHAWTTPF
jgi:hypothetical protein